MGAKIRVALGTLALVLLASRIARADVITECGGLSGWTYFFPGDMVPKSKAGWTKDSISGGQIIYSKRNGEPTILYRDATGLRDALADGGKLIIGPSDDPTIEQVIHLFSTGMESYLFQIDSNGDGQVVVATTRASALISKGSLMRTTCKSPRK
ncbi:MAG: hypothetical protein ACYC1L_13250 [Alphaproteobacteria bacterium]